MIEEIKFSLILPVGHGGSFLRNALKSLHQMDFPQDQFEVLVVGTDGDEESYKNVKDESDMAGFNILYISCSNSNNSVKLNTACARARGLLLVFADDDCIFFQDWLQ